MIIEPLISAPQSASSRKTSRRLALGAIAGPLLFTGAWSVLSVLSPGYTLWGTVIAPYSAVSQPISGLGLGPTGPAMNTAFVICGVVLLVGVIGVFRSVGQLSATSRRLCTGLLALTPVGMVVCGIFTLESFFLHFLGFLLAAGAPVIAFAVTGFVLRRISAWHRFGPLLMWGSPLTLALMVVYFASFTPTVAGVQAGVAGLTQRFLVVEVHAWFVAMGWLALRHR